MLLNEIFGFGKKKSGFNRRGTSLKTVYDVVDQYAKGRLNYEEAKIAIARIAADKEEYSAGMAELMFAK